MVIIFSIIFLMFLMFLVVCLSNFFRYHKKTPEQYSPNENLHEELSVEQIATQKLYDFVMGYNGHIDHDDCNGFTKFTIDKNNKKFKVMYKHYYGKYTIINPFDIVLIFSTKQIESMFDHLQKQYWLQEEPKIQMIKSHNLELIDNFINQ